MIELKKERIETIKLSPYHKVDLTEMGNIAEIRYISKKNHTNTILRIENNQYIDLKTGEIKECKKSEKRMDRLNSLRVTFRKLRNLINANTENPELCQWITLTYRENMQDVKRLYKDFEKFHKRYKYYIKKEFGIEKLEYISVIEPQGRGAWHIHLIYIFEEKVPFVANDKLREIWGHGFVKITSLKDIDNIGAYLTAYLTDLDLSECTILDLNEKSVIKECEVPTTNGTTKKAVVKGSRLKLYPAGFQIMRHSKGIKKPTQTIMSQTEAITKVQGAVKTFERAYRLYDEETGFESVIVKEQFNFNKKIGVNNNGKF